MAFNQNTDTTVTLKLILFLIIIETLMMTASVITTFATTGEGSMSLTSGLNINEFKYYPYDPWETPIGNPNNYYISGTIEDYLKGSYRDSKGHTFAVKEGDLVTLQKDIDVYNSAHQENAVDYLFLLASSFTYSFVPFPLNLIPILIGTIIGFIIFYLAYGEVKAWFDTIYPF